MHFLQAQLLLPTARAAPEQALCRLALAAEARERLFGDAQGYSTLLINPGFWAHKLHVWYTNAEAGEDTWQEVACIELPGPAGKDGAAE